MKKILNIFLITIFLIVISPKIANSQETITLDNLFYPGNCNEDQSCPNSYKPYRLKTGGACLCAKENPSRLTNKEHVPVDIIVSQCEPIKCNQFTCSALCTPYAPKQSNVRIEDECRCFPKESPPDSDKWVNVQMVSSKFQFCITSKNIEGISTAFGCIPISNTNDFIAWFLEWAIGISGGIAFLLIVTASFQIMTASGDPQKLQGARELVTAAISGLILIIFSVFLLRLIGVTILNIPGL